METRARGRAVEAPGDVEQGRLARAARAHDGDELAEADLEADAGQRGDGRLAGAVDAGDVGEDDVCCGHEWFPPWCVVTVRGRLVPRPRVRRPRSRWRRWAAPAAAGGRASSRRGRASGPRPPRRRRGSRGRAARPGRCRSLGERRALGGPLRAAEGLALEAGEVAQVPQRRGALGLHDPSDVDARGGDREGELDRQLVARGARAVDGGAPPGVELEAAGGGEAVGDAALGVGVPGLLDEPVAHEAVEGRVDLPDVQRPGAAGAALELAAELGAVLLALREQGHEARPHRHRVLPLVRHVHTRYAVRRWEMYTEYVGAGQA